MNLKSPPVGVALKHIALFHGLPSHELQIIKPLLRIKSVAASSPLLTMGEVGDSVYFIVEGTICIYRMHGGEKRLILNMVGAGEMLGEVCALDNKGHSANALATEKTLLLQMRRGDFVKIEENQPHLSKNVKHLLTHRLRFATTLCEAMASREVRYRITRLLLALAERYNTDAGQNRVLIPLRLTQIELADWACISRQHTVKYLRQLREENIVQIMPKRRILIMDHHRLKEYRD
jgi:CRP-like cAMP-binding protein